MVGPHDDVRPLAGVSEQIDYESELAVVIGKGGRNISRAEAMGHVFGYTIVNDVTARDVQMRHQQWDLGKSFDTFAPWARGSSRPTSSTAHARVRGWVNGELRQDGQTTRPDLRHPTLIETCSRGITLYPGDVIATGTPAGVGMGMTPPRYLKAGDVVRVEIDGMGAIENRFVTECIFEFVFERRRREAPQQETLMSDVKVTWTGGVEHWTHKKTPEGDIKLFLWEKKASPKVPHAGTVFLCTARRWPRSRPSTCNVPGRPHSSAMDWFADHRL